MIKINLLPQQKRVKSSSNNSGLLLFILGILLAGGIIGAIDWYTGHELEQLSIALKEKNKIADDLRGQVKHVNALMDELQEVERRIAAIKDIRIKQGLPVKYIDEVVVNIPRDKMWMTTFTVNGGKSITLAGVALDNQTFATFVESLRASNYVARVDTQRTARQNVDGLGLVAFRCTVTTKEYFNNAEVKDPSHG